MHSLSSGYSPLFTLGLLQERDSTPDLRSFFSLGLAKTWSFDQPCVPPLLAVAVLTCCRQRQLAPTPLPRPASFRRTSRESMRTIPSPKPAPSTTLPALPVQPSPESRTAPPSPRRTRVSPFLVPSAQKKMHSFSASHLSVVSPTTTSFSPQQHHRTSHSAPQSELDPSLLSPRSPTFTVGSPVHAAHARTRSMSSVARSESITSSAKRRSRMDALACLEGRGRRHHRRLKANFMSWSDDEEDPADEACPPKEHPKKQCIPITFVDDVGELGDVEDEDESDVVVVSPTDAASQPVPIIGAVQPSQLHVRRKRSWKRLSVSPARSAPPSSRMSPAVPLSYPVSASVPILPTARPTSTAVSPSSGFTSFTATSRSQFISASAPPSRQRKRRSTIDSWFAFRSFIDLRTDSEERSPLSSSASPSWNWRSFIEIGA